VHGILGWHISAAQNQKECALVSVIVRRRLRPVHIAARIRARRILQSAREAAWEHVLVRRRKIVGMVGCGPLPGEKAFAGARAARTKRAAATETTSRVHRPSYDDRKFATNPRTRDIFLPKNSAACGPEKRCPPGQTGRAPAVNSPQRFATRSIGNGARRAPRSARLFPATREAPASVACETTTTMLRPLPM